MSLERLVRREPMVRWEIQEEVSYHTAVSRGEGGTVHMAGRVTLSRRANSGVCASSTQDLSEFVVVKEVVGAATVVRSCLSGGAYFCSRVVIGEGGSEMLLWELLLVVGKISSSSSFKSSFMTFFLGRGVGFLGLVSGLHEAKCCSPYFRKTLSSYD